MKKDVLIVGGGITGLSLAWELSCLGIESILIEKAPFIGGHVSQFACKATQTCQKCGACLLEDYLSKLPRTNNIQILVGSRIDSFSQDGREFNTLVMQRRSGVIDDKCDNCGLCEKVCPAKGALFKSPLDSRLHISNEKCLIFMGIACQACAQICPQGAIELEEKDRELEIQSSAIALCTGFTPFDASEKPRLGYQRVLGVLTSLELDSLLRQENFQLPQFSGGLKSIAFIQCVGSRDPKSGANYCSQICCGVSIRLARLMKSLRPEIQITIFYMDIQTFEREFDKTLDQTKNDMTFVRSMPSEIRSGPDGRPEIVYHGNDDTKQIIPFDLVILSIGISPKDPDLPGSFPVLRKDRDGFIGSEGNDVVAGHPGIFVAGAAKGPKSISGCISQSILAASQIKKFLDRINRGE